MEVFKNSGDRIDWFFNDGMCVDPEVFKWRERARLNRIGHLFRTHFIRIDMTKMNWSDNDNTRN